MIDYSNEYLFWDNVEAVSVTLRRQPSDVPVSVSIAQRGNISRRQTTFNGVAINGDEVFWKVPVALLGGSNELHPGDVITDGASVVWIVITAVKLQVGSSAVEWTAMCSKGR